jgi:hypothetical protein
MFSGCIKQYDECRYTLFGAKRKKERKEIVIEREGQRVMKKRKRERIVKDSFSRRTHELRR